MNALYTAASGMLADNQWLSATAGNLANASSAGYLAQTGAMVAFPNGTVSAAAASVRAIGQSPEGVAFTASYNMTPGGIDSTGQSTDLAIAGAGFFVVTNPAGGIAYTRDGRFHLDALGRLVNSAGAMALTTTGAPLILQNAPFSVDSQGAVRQGGQLVGQLALANLGPAGLTNAGQGLYTAPAAAVLPFAGSVVQGGVNLSNVDLVTQSTNMIQAQTSYQSLATLVNEESARLKTVDGLGIIA